MHSALCTLNSGLWTVDSGVQLRLLQKSFHYSVILGILGASCGFHDNRVLDGQPPSATKGKCNQFKRIAELGLLKGAHP